MNNYQQAGFTIVAHGADAVVSKGAWFPDVCVKCGGREALKRRTMFFAHRPWWVYLTACLGLIPYVALSGSLQNGWVSATLCGRCGTRHFLGEQSRAAIAVPILAWYALIVTLRFAVDGWIPGALVALLVVALPLSVVFALLVITQFSNPRVLVAKDIGWQTITLAGVDGDALRYAVAYAAYYGRPQGAPTGYSAPPGYPTTR